MRFIRTNGEIVLFAVIAIIVVSLIAALFMEQLAEKEPCRVFETPTGYRVECPPQINGASARNEDFLRGLVIGLGASG